MRIIRRKDFLNEDKSLFDRAMVEDSIKSLLPSLSDGDLDEVHALVTRSVKGSGNKRIREEFSRMREKDWTEMSPQSRKSWLLNINPELSSTIRGNSFLSMIINNDWKTAKNNVVNFLESLDVRYLKRIEESDGKILGRDDSENLPRDPFWLKPKTKQELLDAISKEISKVSLEALRNIYHIVAQAPGVNKMDKGVNELINALKGISDKWESMGELDRVAFMVEHSPYPVKPGGWLENHFFRCANLPTLRHAIGEISKIPLMISDLS